MRHPCEITVGTDHETSLTHFIDVNTCIIYRYECAKWKISKDTPIPKPVQTNPEDYNRFAEIEMMDDG